MKSWTEIQRNTKQWNLVVAATMGEQSLEHELQILESILFPTCCLLIQTKTDKDKEHKTSKSLTKNTTKVSGLHLSQISDTFCWTIPILALASRRLLFLIRLMIQAWSWPWPCQRRRRDPAGPSVLFSNNGFHLLIMQYASSTGDWPNPVFLTGQSYHWEKPSPTFHPTDLPSDLNIPIPGIFIKTKYQVFSA